MVNAIQRRAQVIVQTSSDELSGSAPFTDRLYRSFT